MAYEKGITKQNNSKYIDLVGYPLPKLNNPTTTNMVNIRMSKMRMPLLKDISYCYSLKSYSQISNLSRLSEASYKKLSSSRYFLPSFKNMENDIPFSANNVIWHLVSKSTFLLEGT